MSASCTRRLPALVALSSPADRETTPPRISFSISLSKHCIPSSWPSRIASSRVLPSTSPGRGERDVDRLAVAHLADEDDLGGLTQSAAQRRRKRRRVAVQLPLMNGSLLVRVQELDGIFDGQDVFGPRFVDAIDDGGQRRRLA